MLDFSGVSLNHRDSYVDLDAHINLCEFLANGAEWKIGPIEGKGIRKNSQFDFAHWEMIHSTQIDTKTWFGVVFSDCDKYIDGCSLRYESL